MLEWLENPSARANYIVDVDPQILKEQGIRYVIFDIDQTIVRQSTTSIPDDINDSLKKFVEVFTEKKICFLSNAIDEERAKKIEQLTGIPVVRSKYRKPSKKAFDDALTLLGALPKKDVAMIGDRLWTDIYGANRINLYSIKVNPLSPNEDALGAKIFRFGEEHTDIFGIKTFFQLFLTFLTLAGFGLVEFLSISYNLVTRSFIISIEDNLLIIHAIFLIAANLFYWQIVVKKSKHQNRGPWISGITYYFNTYPLFLRYLFSWGLLLINVYGIVFSEKLPDNFLSISVFYSFIIHLALITSLNSSYHSNIGRSLRILFDILTIILITYNLNEYYSKYALLFLIVPIGTSAKHNDWFGGVLVTTICSIVAFILLGSNWQHATIFTSIYFGLLFLLKIDTLELVLPIDQLIHKLYEVDWQTNSREYRFREFAKILNCQAIYFIKSKDEGYFYSNYEKPSYNKILPKSNNAIFAHILKHSADVITSPEVTIHELKKMQNSFIHDSEFEVLLRPPSVKGLRSIIVLEVPNKSNHFLILTNSLSKNGIIKRSFSLSHLRTLFLIATFKSVQQEFDKEPIKLTRFSQ